MNLQWRRGRYIRVGEGAIACECVIGHSCRRWHAQSACWRSLSWQQQVRILLTYWLRHCVRGEGVTWFIYYTATSRLHTTITSSAAAEIARVALDEWLPQNGGYYVVQGHSRSLISVPVENPPATSCLRIMSTNVHHISYRSRVVVASYYRFWQGCLTLKHGRRSRGGQAPPPPEYGVGDASANCPSQIFVI